MISGCISMFPCFSHSKDCFFYLFHSPVFPPKTFTPSRFASSSPSLSVYSMPTSASQLNFYIYFQYKFVLLILLLFIFFYFWLLFCFSIVLKKKQQISIWQLLVPSTFFQVFFFSARMSAAVIRPLKNAKILYFILSLSFPSQSYSFCFEKYHAVM